MRTPLDDMIASYLNFRDDRKEKGKQLSIERFVTVIVVFLAISIVFGLPVSVFGVLLQAGFSVIVAEYIGHYMWKHPERLQRFKNRFKF